MDQVLSAIRCSNCGETLSSPVVLPCGHLTCKSHTDSARDQVICSDCGAIHPNTGFVVVKPVEKMVAAQLASIDFGVKHEEARKSLEQLRKNLNSSELLIQDLKYFIHESVDELKNNLVLKSEQLKTLIDSRTDEIIREFVKYQLKCEENLNSQTLKTNMFEYETLIKSVKTKYQTWSNSLNELKVDEEKWKKIKEECDSNSLEIQKRNEVFGNKVLLGEYATQKDKINYFDRINAFSILKSKTNTTEIISNILSENLRLGLFDLCKFDNETKLNLIYQGSRDGFGGADFHRHCDDRTNTLTIIETTKGFIFGGYASVSWSSNFKFCTDPNAYVFSLVNKFYKPFLCKVADPIHAIWSNKKTGPNFGGKYSSDLTSCEIAICSDCNLAQESYSKFNGTYRKPFDLADPDEFYFCDTLKFLVKEIEVFTF